MSVFQVRVNDFDLAAITNEVNKWQSHGKYASYDISRRDSGNIIMTLENVFSTIPEIVIFDIHKMGRKGFLGTKTFWVIQLCSATGLEGPFEKHGCSAAKSLAGALTKAQKDVKFGFMSIVDFQLAVDAMLE